MFISKEFVLDVDECFITNSLMGIMPVKSLGSKTFVKREVASIMEEYQEIIKQESLNVSI